MLLLLQSFPVPSGTNVILTVLAIVLGIISWRQKNWKSTADAAVAEMAVHKEANGRLQKECDQLKETTANLAKQTDLQPLLISLNSLSSSIVSWVTEGRGRFEQATRRLDENTEVLRILVDEVKSQRAISEESYRSLTTSFVSHTIENKQTELEAMQIRGRFMAALEGMEQRLSQVAIQIGIPAWNKPPIDMR